ncbi:unnamed protein product [Cyprideis torosa]|uniref:Protein quiver n=1 Tax=Cyprideis torosa TaxID=163714 RepID=A0A7R8WN51_9CRUS|nr:unnamed protein product [Cyprideis torosa]CAG0900257.1 unnamed protein product [Cyprideis torosa]
MIPTASGSTPFFLLVIALCHRAAEGIRCYECMSSDDLQCGEEILPENTLELSSCDHIFGASFCIKMTRVVEVRVHFGV